MEIFIKKHGSQEAGYSGDIPGQRGPYILIPKKAWGFFPYLSESTLNDSVLISLVMPSRKKVYRHYVWHNSKYNKEKDPGKVMDRDERRFYRGKVMSKELDLDRGVYVLFKKTGDKFEFLVCSVTQTDAFYGRLDSHMTKIRGSRPGFVLSDDSFVEDIFATKFDSDDYKEIASESEAIIGDDIINVYKEEQQKETSGLIQKAAGRQGQSAFRDMVLQAYGNRCVLKKEAVSYRNEILLTAAHIWPDSEGGPMLPANGLALSYDLHRMFDRGMWTLAESRVKVHPKVAHNPSLLKFQDQLVQPIEAFRDVSFFCPEEKYMSYHRENIYGIFAHSSL